MSDSDTRVARAKELKKKRNVAAQSLFQNHKFTEQVKDKPRYKRERVNVKNIDRFIEEDDIDE